MTRDEAIIVIKDAVRGAQLSNRFNKKLCDKFEEALDMAINALEKSKPNPETGLMDCGCGGEADVIELANDKMPLGCWCVKCENSCASTLLHPTGMDAIKAWNCAMGWKEGEDET